MLHHLLALQGFIKLPRLPLKALTIIQLPPHHTHPVNCLYPAQVLITWWHSFWFPSLCPRQMLGQTQGKAQRCLGWLQLRTLAWAGWCHLTICNCGVDTLPGAHYCWVGKLTCFTMWIKAHSNPGFFRGWLLQAFSQGLGPRQLEAHCLGLLGSIVLCIWGRQLISGKNTWRPSILPLQLLVSSGFHLWSNPHRWRAQSPWRRWHLYSHGPCLCPGLSHPLHPGDCGMEKAGDLQNPSSF